MRFALPLMKNMLILLAKRVFTPSGLMTAASAIDPAIQKKIYGSVETTLIIPNEEMKEMK